MNDQYEIDRIGRLCLCKDGECLARHSVQMQDLQEELESNKGCLCGAERWREDQVQEEAELASPSPQEGL